MPPKTYSVEITEKLKALAKDRDFHLSQAKANERLVRVYEPANRSFILDF